jgi:hypothetical protein
MSRSRAAARARATWEDDASDRERAMQKSTEQRNRQNLYRVGKKQNNNNQQDDNTAINSPTHTHTKKRPPCAISAQNQPFLRNLLAKASFRVQSMRKIFLPM